MIVAIWAFENQYGGLHGIESHDVVEVECIEEAIEIAQENSRNVIESYGNIMEDFETAAQDDGLESDTDEFWEYIEECIVEDIAFFVYMRLLKLVVNRMSCRTSFLTTERTL